MTGLNVDDSDITSEMRWEMRWFLRRKKSNIMEKNSTRKINHVCERVHQSVTLESCMWKVYVYKIHTIYSHLSIYYFLTAGSSPAGDSSKCRIVLGFVSLEIYHLVDIWTPRLGTGVCFYVVNPARPGPGLWNHFKSLSSACSFCTSLLVPR